MQSSMQCVDGIMVYYEFIRSLIYNKISTYLLFWVRLWFDDW
jgi:hypothetical protein